MILGTTVLMHFLEKLLGNKRVSQNSKLRNEEAMGKAFVVSIDFVFILNQTKRLWKRWPWDRVLDDVIVTYVIGASTWEEVWVPITSLRSGE